MSSYRSSPNFNSVSKDNLKLTPEASQKKLVLEKWNNKTKLSEEFANFISLLMQTDSQEPKKCYTQESNSEDRFWNWYSEIDKNSFETINLLKANYNTELNLFKGENMNYAFIDFERTLNDQIKNCDNLLKQLGQSSNYLNEIENKYSTTLKSTSELYHTCGNFLRIEEKTREFLEILKQVFFYFELTDSIFIKFNSLQLKNENYSHFTSLLAQLDQGIEFFRKNSSIMQSDAYMSKLKLLQNKAIAMLSDHIISTMKSTIVAGKNGKKMEFKNIGDDSIDFKRNSSLNLFKNSSDSSSNNNNNNNNSKLDSLIHAPLSVPELKKSSPTLGSESLFNSQSKSYFLHRIIIDSNIKHRSISASIRPLCIEIEKRKDIPEYSNLLSNLKSSYLNIRKQILEPYVKLTLDSIIVKGELPLILKETFSFLISLCEQEFELFSMLFIHENYSLRELLGEFANILNDYLRPRIIKIYEIDQLCSMIDVLQYEIKTEYLIKKDELASLKPIIDKVVQDIQDRLIFISNIFIRDEIEQYRPPKEVLDYPNNLILNYNIIKSEEKDTSINSFNSCINYNDIDKNTRDLTEKHDDNNNNDTDANITNKENENNQSNIILRDDKINIIGQNNTIHYDGPIKFRDQTFFHINGQQVLYPTLIKTLSLLLKLHLNIETSVFNAISQQVIMVCTQSLCIASKLIEQKQGRIDGNLFLIKHLIILQEQVIPFEIDFFIREQKLDFSESRKLLKSIISGQVAWQSLFSISRNNAIFTIIQATRPKIRYLESDMRENMQKLLAQTIEDLVLVITQQIVGQIIKFLTSSSNFKKQKDEKLRSQSFASDQLIKSLIEDFKTNLQQKLVPTLLKINLYLNFHSNRLLIFNSIKSHLSDPLESFNALIKEEYPDLFDESIIIDTNETLNLLDSTYNEAIPFKNEFPTDRVHES